MPQTFKALVLNDYEAATYADWVKWGYKTVETRMKRLFTYRGDIVICCGKTNSKGKNAGNALCLVEIYDGGPMKCEDVKGACIGWHKDRKALYLRNLRHFSRDFKFCPQYVSGTYQGIFEIALPADVEILPFRSPGPHDLVNKQALDNFFASL